jgi:hypothetical protein
MAWQNWSSYACECRIDPWLRFHNKPSKQAVFFPALESSGTQSRLDTKLWRKRSVTWRKPSCWQASTTLVGPTVPRSLDLPFGYLLRSYKTQDPAPQPQLDIPVATIEQAAAYHQAPNSPLTRTAADLITTEFFFLLGVGEYTMLKRNTSTRTIQFRVQDITFRQADGTVILTTAPLPSCSLLTP